MADLSVGDEVAGYRIDARLARGGMGVVYRATHLGLDRPVALKVIARELAGDASFRDRFLRESRLAARLDHPAVVPVFDSREVDDELIVAMRLVEGGDLRGLIDREGPLTPEHATALLGQVAAALDAAHAAGIVHRDVKPHNVLVEGDRAYLSDFGLAKSLDESGASGASVVGTAAYMSPEQWRGETVGPPADIYSLGCVLFETITGVVPYARADADPESTPRMPAGLEGAIERATAPRPEDRFATATELIDAARGGEREPIASDPSPRRRERSPDSDRPAPRTARPNLVAEVDRRPAAVVLPSAIRIAVDLRRSGSDVRTTAAGGVDEGTTAVLGGGGGGARGGRAALAGGVALVLVAAVVAAVLLLTGGSSGPTVAEPVAIGKPPLRIAAGSEKIWVLSEPEGTLTRIDAETDRILGAPVDLGKGVAAVAVGGGSVWVSDERTGELLRVDDETSRVTQRIKIGGHPGPLVYGGGRVWVADTRGAGITAVNAKGGRVVRRRLAAAHRPAPPRRRRRRPLGLERRHRQRPPHRPLHLRPRQTDPRGPRPRRRHRRRRPRLGRRRPLRRRHPRRPLPRRGQRPADPCRRRPRRHRRRPEVALGHPRRRRRGPPPRTSVRRTGRRPDPRRPRPRRPRGRRHRGLGGQRR